MTNAEIIYGEAVLNGLWTEDEMVSLVKEYGSLPLHTFQAWKHMGYKVKKGEHARITTQLWKYQTKENEKGEKEEKCFLCKAHLFTNEQVERMVI